MKVERKYEMINPDFGDRFEGTRKEIEDFIIESSEEWMEEITRDDFSENLDGLHVQTSEGWVLVAVLKTA